MLIKTLPKILLLCLTINLLLTACGSDATPSDNLHTGSPALPWQKKWLSSKDCQLPCWEGITPGKTDVHQALDIVKAMPNIRLIDTNENLKYGDGFNWYWSSNGISGGIYYSLSNSLVRSIAPYIGTNFSLGEVIQAYGQPDYVLTKQGTDKDIGGHPRPVLYITILIYLTHGFEVEAWNADKGALNDNTLVSYLEIFEPTKKGMEDAIGLPTSYFSPWQGYKDFDFYNKNRQ